METTVKQKRTIKTVSWIAVLSSWLTFPIFFIMPFSLLFWIAALIYLFFNKSNYKWFLLLASTWTIAPVWSSVVACMQYAQGRAVIKSFGLPGKEFFNLDPDLRAWNQTSGCIVTGFEPFTQLPNNLTVRFLTSLFGVQKNAYKGVYPTKQQAKDLISKGEPVTVWEQDHIYRCNYKNQPLTLRVSNAGDLYELNNCTMAKAAVVNNECLVLELQTDTTRQMILLADKANEHVFARYYYN